MCEYILKYHIGQLVEHKKFTYRGVVYDADAEFSGSDEWYLAVARSCPPKDAPWYHVLVDDGKSVTYVAERHLQEAFDCSPVRHQLIDVYFSDFVNKQYIVARQQ